MDQVVDDVGVLEADIVLAQGLVHNRNECFVKALCFLQEVFVLGAVKEVVGAGLCVCTVGGRLKPAIVFAARTSVYGIDRNELVTIHRCLDLLSVGKGLDGLVRGVEALQEALSRVLEHVVDGSSDGKLRELCNVLTHSLDPGVAREIPRAVVLTRCIDLLVAQRGEVGGSQCLGSTVTMAVEDVSTQYGLCSFSRGEGRREREGNGQLHLDGRQRRAGRR